MPQFTDADTIRILVATDNHVGFEERDPIRKDDSWKTFDEIINLARIQDVDMVLLAGDLFHDNKPSRKAMYQVMRSLRMNCLGMKPCELEFLSDANEIFEGAFPHVNYEDPDINVSIPVFSIHGNHDDPSGDGHFCSLDLLQCAGLVNYFGRVAEADNIEAKPVLLQKGQTKLALYGLSNVRDERMFRTFRDHKVKWFRPGVQRADWFNLLAVHQNHHAHTATSYLPENVLPDWLNLVVWGHEHECLIDPRQNAETGFHVMQPGSSVATSLVHGEAVQKHVAVVSITGRDFKIEKLPLKTVRPFVARDIVLGNEKLFKGVDKKPDNRQEVTRRLMSVVEEMIEQANADWHAVHADDEELPEQPLPLIRLKVDYTAPDGGKFECENPQRFSNRFIGKVANTNDVVYFHRKKSGKSKLGNEVADDPEDVPDIDDPDAIRVDALVEDFLAAQSLKILPQAPFGDAVNQFVNKDDKHAMEAFVSESLAGQVKQMLDLDSDDENLDNAMEQYRAKLEEQFRAGLLKRARRLGLKPKPDDWDSDLDGHWADQPQAIDQDIVAQLTASRSGPRTQAAGDESDDMMEEPAPATKAPAGRKGSSRATKAAPAKKAPARKAPAKKAPARGRAKKVVEEEEEEEDDVIMEDDEVPEPTPVPKRAQPARGATTRTRQSKLDFSQKASTQKAVEISDDEISDDSDDPFESVPPTRSRQR